MSSGVGESGVARSGSNLTIRPPSVHVEMYEPDNSHRDQVFLEKEDDEEDEDDESEVTLEDYDPQTVTVPITLCLTIMVG